MKVFFNKKKRTLVLCALSLYVVFSPVTKLDVYANSAISIEMDGKKLSMPVEPVIMNDRTMVPMKAVFEAYGMEVNWDGDTKTITSTKTGFNVVMQIGNLSMSVNGKAVPMDVAPVIVDGSTMMPLRAISEALGAEVGWNSAERLVVISSVPTEKSEEKPKVEAANISLEERSNITFDNDKIIKFLEYIPTNSYDESKLPVGIEYVVTGLQSSTSDPKTFKTAPLKAGDKFAVYREQSFGQGLYIYQIPENAVAIHSSGDMRYGWVDYSISQDIIDYVNFLREKQHSDNYSKSVLTVNTALRNYDNGSGLNVSEFHFKSVYDAGIEPLDFGLNYTGSLDAHYPSTEEILSYGGIAYWKSSDNSVDYDMDFGALLMALVNSPMHYDIMVNLSNKTADACLIMRPDMNAKVIINFSN